MRAFRSCIVHFIYAMARGGETKIFAIAAVADRKLICPR